MRLFRYCQFFITFFLIVCLASSSFAKGNHPHKSRTKQYSHRHEGLQVPPGPLSKQIEWLLRAYELSDATVSMKVVSLSDDKIIYAKNPDLALNPASNMKLVTEATALKELGGNYIFKTEFYSDTSLDMNGKIHNLWIKGYGDPLLVTEELESMIDDLIAIGLKEITGSVYVDNSFFDKNANTTYVSDRGDKIYNIVTSPLAFNFNRNMIRARSNSGMGDEDSYEVKKLPRQKMKKGSFKKHVRVSKHNIRQCFSDPSLYTGSVIIEEMEKRGLRINQNRSTPQKGLVPLEAKRLLTHNSPPLREVLKGMGKFSNNFVAEQVLKTISAEKSGQSGSTTEGAEMMKNYLVSLNIPKNSFSLDNGSGLSKNNRLSAAHFVTLLERVYHSPFRNDFLESLSVGGIDGTLKKRMKSPFLYGRVFGKTGTLNGVSTLSGYFIGENKKLAFSFLLNDLTISNNKANRAKEEILKTIVAALERTPS